MALLKQFHSLYYYTSTENTDHPYHRAGSSWSGSENYVRQLLESWPPLTP